jgi:prolyl oligopeptidase
MALDPADPYGFLEDAADPASVAWTAAQNARTRGVLDALAGRADLARRFDELLATDALGLPVRRGTLVFYTARRGSATQRVLYVRSDDGERVLVDPTAIDPTGLTALDWWFPSPLGSFVAAGFSRSGDERSTLEIIAVSSSSAAPESIPDTRFCSLAWLPDESGFYYTRFPPGGTYDSRVYRHVLGRPWNADELLFGDGRAPEDMLELALSSNGRYLSVRAWSGWARSDAFVADTTLGEPPVFVPLAEGRDAVYDVLPGNTQIYLRTNEGAPRFRVFAVDPARPERAAWREIVAEGDATLDGFALSSGGLVLHALENVRSVLRLRHPSGRIETLPGLGDKSVLGFTAREDDDVLFVLASSFLEPPVALRYQLGRPGDASATPDVWETVRGPVDPAKYRVDQEWFVSRDGTRVPMWILAGRDVARDGTAATVLYGYGGFDVALVPDFTASAIPWLEAGGVYAVANLRGGGEFGDAWHRAGMRERKQNVFDDFSAAVEHLGAARIADPARIAVVGGSNGGLLTAALVTQRPDLVAAAVCAVPLTDMLRFHLFPIGRLWIAEYGDPDVAADAEFLRAYSPYHAVRDGVAYPATFVETAESDGRVDPMHAKKFAARLQTATSGDAPILLYVEPDAGHGAGKPRDKIVAELTDRWSFIAWRLGMTLGERFA